MSTQTGIFELMMLDCPSYLKVVYHDTDLRCGSANTTYHGRDFQIQTVAMVPSQTQAPQAFPLSFEEIEALVKQLSAPGNPKKISETEATLKVLQRSPQGWDIADALLNSSDQNVRFFGAHTFTVKLNSDS